MQDLLRDKVKFVNFIVYCLARVHKGHKDYPVKQMGRVMRSKRRGVIKWGLRHSIMVFIQVLNFKMMECMFNVKKFGFVIEAQVFYLSLMWTTRFSPSLHLIWPKESVIFIAMEEDSDFQLCKKICHHHTKQIHLPVRFFFVAFQIIKLTKTNTTNETVFRFITTSINSHYKTPGRFSSFVRQSETMPASYNARCGGGNLIVKLCLSFVYNLLLFNFLNYLRVIHVTPAPLHPLHCACLYWQSSDFYNHRNFVH